MTTFTVLNLHCMTDFKVQDHKLRRYLLLKLFEHRITNINVPDFNWFLYIIMLI